MSMSMYPLLDEALRQDNAEQFTMIFQDQTSHWHWPRDSATSDYELLMRAIKLGCKRIVNLLLAKGAEVFKNGCKTTPLHQAVTIVGWDDVIVKLLALGARVGIQNCRGDTVLHQAFKCGAPKQVVNILLNAYAKETKMDKKNKDGLSFIHIASSRSTSKYLQDYLDAYETDIDAQVSMYSDSRYAGYTSLHFAVANGRYDNVRILLENGAEIFYQDANGSTPVHLALEKRNTQMIDLLLSYDKTNQDIVNNMGLSHFMAACAGNELAVVEEFLNVASTSVHKSYHMMLISQVNHDLSYQYSGYTALHFAAEFGQALVVQGLITINEYGPTVVTTSRMTPFMLAFQYQHLHICLMMMQICRSACDEELINTLFAYIDEGMQLPAGVIIDQNANQSFEGSLDQQQIMRWNDVKMETSMPFSYM